MSRDVAFLFGLVSSALTTILFFRCLDVDNEIKTMIGLTLDKIPTPVLALVSLISLCLPILYLGDRMLREGLSITGIIFLLGVFAVGAIDVFFGLKDNMEGGL